MIVLTQLFYLHPGQADSFATFEAGVIPLLAAHGAELLLRIQPAPGASGSLPAPHELHIVRFPDEAALAAYLADPRRAALLPLRARAVAAVETFRAG